MRKVMIVEDEELILQGIKSIVPWDALDLMLTHMAVSYTHLAGGLDRLGADRLYTLPVGKVEEKNELYPLNLTFFQLTF